MNVFENFGISGGGGGGRVERVALMNTRATDILASKRQKGAPSTLLQVLLK